jgi:archaemetzincin
VSSPSPNTILIAPIGQFDPGLIETVAKGIERVFGLNSAVSSLISDLTFAFDSKRGQYHSTPILAKLAAAAPSWALKVLALTTVDLFIPILTHVSGEAQLGGRACIVSFFRLNEGPSFLHVPQIHIERLVKEAIHELGHTFRLRHCPSPVCPMHYCRSEADVDHKSDKLCRYCQVLLQDELKRSRTQT